LGTGLEGQGSVYGYGGDNGAPFIYIHQSPYIDFCSAHVYPTETWANKSINQTSTLLFVYARDAHVTVGKPFFFGEFNVMNGSSYGTRSDYWVGIYQTIQFQNIDGSAFWWYEEANKDGEYGVQQGAPELAIFRAHSQVMQAKSGTSVTTTLGLASSGSPSTYGNAVTFTATVQTNGVAVGNISGEPVTFYDGAVALGTGTLNGSGQATDLTGASQISVATHSITAVYGGDNTCAGSTNSPALSQTINRATLTYSANPASMTYGSSVPTLSGSVNGFVSGDNQGNATTGTLIFTTPATSSSSVGGYAVNGSGLTANNGNYTFVQAAGNATALSILPLVTPTFAGQGISVGSGGWQLSFSAQAGQNYRVLASDNLTLPLNQWTVLTNGTFGAGTVTITDNSTNLPIRFYRIVSP
jgi:hypothetical protein